MKPHSPISYSGSRRGSVTVELVAAAVFFLLPLVWGLGELARLDCAARRLQYGAQRQVLEAAMAGNADPSFRLMPIEAQVSVSMRPLVQALPGGRLVSVTLRRCYWIATGSGHGGTGD